MASTGAALHCLTDQVDLEDDHDEDDRPGCRQDWDDPDLPSEVFDDVPVAGQHLLPHLLPGPVQPLHPALQHSSLTRVLCVAQPPSAGGGGGRGGGGGGGGGGLHPPLHLPQHQTWLARYVGEAWVSGGVSGVRQTEVLRVQVDRLGAVCGLVHLQQE